MQEINFSSEPRQAGVPFIGTLFLYMYVYIPEYLKIHTYYSDTYKYSYISTYTCTCTMYMYISEYLKSHKYSVHVHVLYYIKFNTCTI